MATTKIIQSFTHCTIDCEELGHDWLNHTVCDRCGAHVHTRVFVVSRTNSDGTTETLSVGSECFKDVMGYSWKKSHDKAVEIHAHLVRLVAKWNGQREQAGWKSFNLPVARIEQAIAIEGRHPFLSVPKYVSQNGSVTWGGCKVKTAHGLTASVMSAGEDIGLWKKSQRGCELNLAA